MLVICRPVTVLQVVKLVSKVLLQGRPHMARMTLFGMLGHGVFGGFTVV